MKTIYFIIACICALLPWAAQAQTFTSVDINPGADSSNPGYFMQVGNQLFFTASDGVHGNELWVSDGTQGGTHMVKDIWQGPGPSGISYMIAFNNKLYFTADDSIHGYELWVSDGTSAGTTLVDDIWPGTGYGYPYDFINFNGKLYFTADDSTHGYELWTSDGTTAGTAMVDDIWPGVKGSDPGDYSQFYEYNNKLYFNADDGTHGVELWVTDGTSGGTSMLADIYPGSGDSYAGYTYGNPRGFVTLNNKLYFGAEDSLHGWELWQTDGTTGGTILTSDIWPGKSNSYAGYYGGFTLLNGKLYFSAQDSLHSYELWTSDGTGAGTLLVKDINPGNTPSYPLYYAAQVFDNKLFFDAESSGNNLQLYSTDGTTAGTVPVTGIYSTGPNGFDPYQLVAFNNDLFLEGQDSTQGWQLYSLTSADSLMLLAPPIAPNLDPLYTEGTLYPFNGSLAFAASYNSIGNELWFYTPVPAAIGHVQALNGITVYPNPFSSGINLTGLQNGVEYHISVMDIQGRELENYQLTGTGATNTLNLPATLASGMYLLQLSNGDAAETVKIVKQ